MNEPLISIKNLSKAFTAEKNVLENLTLTLPQGKIIGFVGPDGSGKTTLLRLITALLKPTTGTIEVLGYDTLLDSESIHAISGYMPQRFGLYEELTVYQNLDLYASLRGLEKENRTEVFEQLLHFTHLANFTQRQAGALSGGMKQKLGLACALIKKPQLLILDEPSVGVDPISRHELWKMVELLLKEGVSVIWSTTYLDEAQKCDQIVLLNEGKLLYQGSPNELTKKMEGRVFQIEDASINRREHLSAIENQEDVIDAFIQGSSIRVVAKGTVFNQGKPTAPRLEDAFIDILGGKKKGESKLSLAAPISPKKEGNAVSAKNLVKKFGLFTAVGGVSFDVKRGEVFGLLGPNGAGKSTIFKMLCGLLKPTEGIASIDGIDLQKSPTKARSNLGYMAQKFSLYGNLSVSQNLDFFCNIYPTTGTVEQKLELFDLTPYKDTSAETLSLGYKQRLALAVATIHWPEVLFLDEPTSGMDPVSRREFWSQMNGLVRKGKTILISTHFMDEAENCDRIALIYQGRIIHLDTPQKLKELAAKPENPSPTLEETFTQLIQEYDAARV